MHKKKRNWEKTGREAKEAAAPSSMKNPKENIAKKLPKRGWQQETTRKDMKWKDRLHRKKNLERKMKEKKIRRTDKEKKGKRIREKEVVTLNN